jgi:3-deoxy-D-manno-octulosonate 8-phosphate phosphatase (KDO 8-P phosphatase)
MKKLTREAFVERFRSIRLLALDVDGVLTDDSIYFGPDGFELKRFNISDGFFIVLAMRAGLEIAVVSGRYSEATDTRMKDLGVKHVFQDRKDKVKMLEPLCDDLSISFEEVAFVGNELLDIGLAQKVGLPIAVADAVSDLKDCCAFVTRSKGGDGAVREILECYFEVKGFKPQEFIKG